MLRESIGGFVFGIGYGLFGVRGTAFSVFVVTLQWIYLLSGLRCVVSVRHLE
jgi:hypothetical protein